MTRVVITGVGFVSSLALDAPGTWAGMLAGRCGLRPLTKLDLPLEPARLAGEIDLPPDHAPRHTTFGGRLALLSLKETLAGGPDLRRLDPRRMGVFQGAGTTGLPSAEAYLQARLQGRRPITAEPVLQSPNRVTDALAEALGAEGPRSSVMNACSSSLLALGQAWERIAAGGLDLAVAGGAESLCRTTYAGFACLKAMDPSPCRPFSADRAGMNLGEGSAQFLLEPLPQAQARGAYIYAEVVGYGASLDAHHPTAPHPDGEGAARALTMALRTGRLNADDIDMVSAHATATPANDGAECLAIRLALGAAADRVSLTATKAHFGHTLGASGAVGTFAAVMALEHQVVSPTLRLTTADPLCDLDCTPLQPKERRVRAALVNAFAFGGNNLCLALRRWEGK